MTDKNQYTNNIADNDQWCELNTDQWSNDTTMPIVAIVYAWIKYTTIDTYNYFITASKKIYHTTIDSFNRYITKNSRGK